MKILTVRTDKPEAEIGLYEDETQCGYVVWSAHRQLAETIHTKIEELLRQHDTTLHDLEGIVVYKGPGSFTGLRIGTAVANSLAYALEIPLVATNNHWIEDGIAQLVSGQGQKFVVPEYGGEAVTTVPKK